MIDRKPKLRPKGVWMVPLVALLTTACATTTVTIPVEKNSLSEIYLERKKGEGKAGEEGGYAHPAAFSEAQIERLLGSIQVKYEPGLVQRLITGEGKEVNPAFSEDEIAQMASGISNALQQATPADQVGFLVRHPRGIFGARLTTGVIFIQDGRFALTLGNYRYAPPPGGIGGYKDFQHPLESKDAQVYSLIPGPYQELTDGPSRRLKNRTVQIDYARLLEAQPEEPPPAPGSPTPLKETLEEKLRQLKRLYEQKLITEEEYKEKKKQLLDEF